jgi:hypothetical protein
VIYHHALRNALLPIVTIIGLQFGTLLGGAVITETVFAWPGIGRLLIDAIGFRDYPVIQGTVLVIAAGFVLTNLVVDVPTATSTRALSTTRKASRWHPNQTHSLTKPAGKGPPSAGPAWLRRLRRNPMAMIGLLIVLVSFSSGCRTGGLRRMITTWPTFRWRAKPQ